MGQHMPRVQQTVSSRLFRLLACSRCRRQLPELTHAIARHADGLQAQELLHCKMAEGRHRLPAAVLRNVLLQQRLQTSQRGLSSHVESFASSRTMRRLNQLF